MKNLNIYQVSNYGNGSFFSSYLQFCIIAAESKEEALRQAKEKLRFEKHENFEIELLAILGDVDSGTVIYTHSDSDY